MHDHGIREGLDLEETIGLVKKKLKNIGQKRIEVIPSKGRIKRALKSRPFKLRIR